MLYPFMSGGPYLTIIKVLVNEIRKSTQDQTEETFDEIPKDHLVFKQMSSIIDMAQSAGTVQIPVRAAQLICNLLFTDSLKRVQIEIFVVLLQKLCEMSSTTNKEVVTWLMQQDDEVSCPLCKIES